MTPMTNCFDCIVFPSHIDLIEAAQNELTFLNLVDHEPNLLEGPAFQNALRRYESLWLPLFNNPDIQGDEIQAPLDIEWIWQAHILDLSVYTEDCKTIAQKEVNHRIHTYLQREESSDRGREIWEKTYPNEPFEVDFNNIPASVQQYNSKLKCDFKKACVRLRNLYFNVSLPHHGDTMFLMSSLKRYKQHLYLTRENPNRKLVPCCDVDLIWTTHLLHPSVYKEDIKDFLGHVLQHPDATMNILEISKRLALERETKSVWQECGLTYSRPGVTFRGEAPRPALPAEPTDAYRLFSVFEFEIELVKFETENFESGKTFSFRLQYSNKELIWKKRIKGLSNSLEGDGEEALAKFMVNTDDKNNITFSFRQKKMFSKTPTLSHAIDLTQYLETALITETIAHSFRIQIPIFGPANRKAYVTFRTCVSPKPLRYRFTISPEPDFAKFDHPVDVLSAPRSFLKREFFCLRRVACELSLYHLYGHRGDAAFSCRLVNAEPEDVMVLEVLNNDGKTVSYVQLVDNALFPRQGEPLEDSSKFLTTTKSGSETVLLIRGNAADWGICIGMKTANKMSLDEEENVAKIRFFKLGEKHGWCDVKKTDDSLLIQISPNEDSVIEIKPDQGQVTLPIDVNDVPECIATAVSFMLLPSLCYLVNYPENGGEAVKQREQSNVASVVIRCSSLSRFCSPNAP